VLRLEKVKGIISLLAFSLLLTFIGVGGALFNEGPIKKLKKYGIEIPEDATLTVDKIIYDRTRGRDVRFIEYKVPSPDERSITIKLDTSTDELLFYSDGPRMEKQVRISVEEAKEKALEFIKRVTELPKELKLTKAELLHQKLGLLPGGGVLYDYWEYWFEWSRLINGIEVKNEYIRVIVAPSSGDVIAYVKHWTGEQPRNTEVKISKEQAVELGREYLIERRRALIEAILKAEYSELVVKRFSSAAVEWGYAPEGLWLCWEVKFTYTELPEGLEFLKWSIVYVQATTGEVLFVNEPK